MGFGFSHYVLYIHMQKSFHKHRGLATGLFAATRAASGALMPQMANLMSEKFGYRIMMRILAGLSGLSFLFAFIQTLHIPPSDLLDSQTNKPEKNNNNNNNNNGTDDDDNEEGSDLSKTQSVVELLEASDSKLAQSWQKLRNSMDFSVLKEPSFLIFTAVDCLLSFTMTNVFLTLPFFSVERGFEPWVAASLLTTTSVAEVLGGLVIPPLFDVPRVNFLYIFCGLQFLGSILFVVIGFDVDKIGMIVICAVFGLVRSGTVGMCNVFLIRQLTIKRFPSALSAKVLFKFGMFCIGPITGHIVDLTGSYKTSFFIFGGVMAMTGIASATFPCFIKLKKKEAYEVNV
ncbi:unnamed protein product [Notodromas monacha]|uniref:Uncharacterized protein n=1 Tax=Notodromas monacha TaxID=399045 RepID=A0A7R9C2C3_9CRUS|nr:unnamed protein product [Notodromas monacha]CAG0924819.1 unnamed protein product [Notodromas monacha]